ncbi:uncharacterized protein LOC129737647 [Uranotaenia lowii]|uniref:uncharacterized protein LOC129737647 n=1 Tax=Uranotaenia lowii TaxID=190385 RepID=UPI002479B96B|nr:uncharacterized protein LOC129737647 [Uranotaenia lowii]
MTRFLIPKAVWETIAIDFNGPYAIFGGIYILVIVDYRSRYVIAKPVKSTNCDSVKRVLDEIFKREGFPRSIKSDNGPPFSSEEFKRYCSQRGIRNIFSTPLFPQQNGLVESCMKLINKAMIVAVSNQSSYVEELQLAVEAYNSAAHSITAVPPEELMSGRKIRRGLPLLQYAKVNHDDDAIDKRDTAAKLRVKCLEDSKRSVRECRIKEGDVVITQPQARKKGDARFSTTRYTVVSEEKGKLILTDDQGNNLSRHVSQVKRVGHWRQPYRKDASTEELTRSSEELETNVPGNSRATRERKAPGYLSEYVLVVEQRPRNLLWDEDEDRFWDQEFVNLAEQYDDERATFADLKIRLWDEQSEEGSDH